MSDGTPCLRPLVVTHNYPTPELPNFGAFVEALVRQWTRAGTETCVIAPNPYFSLHTKRFTRPGPDSSAQGEPTVLRPGHLTFSNRVVGPIRTARLSLAAFRRSVLRAARRIPFGPDVVYAHFLFPSGHTGLELAERLGVPAVVAVGESGFSLYEETLGRARVEATARRFDGIVSVSQGNRDWVVERYGVDPERVVVVPNATDTEHFRPRDRAALREELGLPRDRVLVGFSGHFDERKGPLRVMEAIRELPEVGAVFLGSGAQQPSGEQVLVARRVPNAEVARYMAATDVYVLPTLNEGSPNAVIEAMACGLPIVSSDIPSLRETVPPEAAHLVDPRDIDALRGAIRTLVDDAGLRERMGAAARAHAERSSIAARADRIRSFLCQVVERGRR
ncbi:MAG: glycosyltransferase [Myxococcota bacterium]